MQTANVNGPPTCQHCQPAKTATCCRQLSKDPYSWEWRCDDCCDHSFCIEAQLVPVYYGEMDEKLRVRTLELNEAYRVLARIAGRDQEDRIRNLVGSGHGTVTCLGCSGTGKLSRWNSLFRRACRRCDGLGYITVKLPILE